MNLSTQDLQIIRIALEAAASAYEHNASLSAKTEKAHKQWLERATEARKLAEEIRSGKKY